MSNADDKKPVVVVSQETQERIRNWVAAASGEVSWVGEVILGRIGKRIVAWVDEVAFLKQWGQPGLTVIDPKELAKWMESKGFVDGETTPKNWYWGHSHVNMGCFWSQTDEECIESFLQFAGSGVVASVVYNKRNEWAARMDVNVGSLDNAEQWTHEADMQVERPDYETKEECERQVKELVTWGRPPERDLSDPRIKALQDAEDAEAEEERGKRGAQGSAKRWNSGAHGGGREGKQIYGYCKECELKEYCAVPVISPGRGKNGGCYDKAAFLPMLKLMQLHWDEARREGTERQLQSWRDKRREMMEKHLKEEKKRKNGAAGAQADGDETERFGGETEGCAITPSQASQLLQGWKYCSGVAHGEQCKVIITTSMRGYFEHGKCTSCCYAEGTIFGADGIRIGGPKKVEGPSL